MALAKTTPLILVWRIGQVRTPHSHLAFGLVLIGIFVAILIFTVIFSKISHGVAAGARLGLLFGIRTMGAFVAVNYDTIHTSVRLAVEIGIKRFESLNLP